MNKIGLALSGGGFRGSLYHLGLVRFLRDAGILSQVTHITSVSGGSIFSAHLVLNWDRYNGSTSEFDAAAAEFLAFVRLNVRSRILRRFPLTLPLRWIRRLLGKSNRKLTRTGLLEYHYERFLYGDVSLFELPVTPKLHLLTTNLSEGCLCSFNRDGLIMVRREAGHAFRIDRIHTGLATVPMAVTASSAFPGFFPPLELTGAEAGVSGGGFGRQSYTDGGVYDNLGVRMFRFLDRQILADDHLAREDFIDIQAAFEALRAASISAEETPLRRVVQVLEEAGKSAEDTPLQRLARVLEEVMGQPELFQPSGPGAMNNGVEGSKASSVDLILSGLWDVMCHYQFQHEALFAGLKPVDPDAQELLQSSRIGAQKLDTGDQVWLNRHLLEAAFRQATGNPCFRRLNSGLDCVIVSDVGKQIEVKSGHAGGLIRTALRASDILMDRVWQLENETFQGTRGFVFAPITDVVEQSEDPTALHPEIQRQAANIRTDLDRFSELEISSLIRHGYCSGRKVCRTRPDLFGKELPDTAPWDPVPARDGAAPTAAPATPEPVNLSREPSPTTAEARTLQASSGRRIWSTLLDRRDWTTYIYVPLLVPILFLLPYFALKYYQRSVRLTNLTVSFAQGSPDLANMSRLLEDGAQKPWIGVSPETDSELTDTDTSGFEILQDSRIVDLRAWDPASASSETTDSRIYGYRRMVVAKRPDNKDQSLFVVALLPTAANAQVRFPRQRLGAKVRKTEIEAGRQYLWEAIFDFEKVPASDTVEIYVEYQSPGLFLRGNEHTTVLAFDVTGETAEITQWFLMPKGKSFKDYRYIQFKIGEPETAVEAKLLTRYLSKDGMIVAYKILSADPGYTHEISWTYD